MLSCLFQVKVETAESHDNCIDPFFSFLLLKICISRDFFNVKYNLRAPCDYIKVLSISPELAKMYAGINFNAPFTNPYPTFIIRLASYNYYELY